MPQNDEEIKYIVTAEDLASGVFDNVNDNLDSMDDKAAKAGAAVKFLADDVERMSPKFVSGVASSEKFRLSLAGIREVADKFDQKVGPAAAAISSISSSLGNSGGKMGVLVDTLGQAAAAFAVAGPLGAGLVATTVAVDAYTASVAATEEAHKKFIEELKKVPEGLQKVWDSVTKAQETALRYQEQANAVGLENWQVDIANLQKEQTILEDTARAKEKELKLAREELKTLEEVSRSIRNSMFSSMSDARVKEMEKAKAVVADLEGELQKTKDGATSVADSINKITDALVTAEERKKIFAPVKIAVDFVPPSEQEVRDLLSSRLDFQGDPIAIQVDVDTKNQAKSNAVDAANQREEELKAIRLKAQRDELADVIMAEWDKADAIKQRQRDLQNELLKEKVQFIKDAYAYDEAYFKNYAGAATQAVSIATSAFQGYLEAKIKGEENAELLMIASIMRVAGQSLIGSGIELIGEGVRNAMTPPLTPLGLAQIGTGSALVATGVGLGGAAAGIEKFAGGSSATPDGADKKDAKSTTGVSTDASSARERDSGGSTINIIYNGMAGPTADNTARTFAKVEARSRRRGLLTGT